MSIALTRAVPRSITECELTHVERSPIDVARARSQHESYERALMAIGLEVCRLAETPQLPDSVFVEDTAVVLDELAILARPGADSRRAEIPSVESALAGFRPLARIVSPGTLDGGDVLVLDREIIIGLSARTNGEGIAQLRSHVAPFGYAVSSAAVRGCLHLKSAVTRIGPRSLVINPGWVDPSIFPSWTLVIVDPGEPFAANALWWSDTVIYPEEHPLTKARIEGAGVQVLTVPAGELAKAEGGVTCCSLIISQPFETMWGGRSACR
jgi:dimethylargininase